MDFDCIQTHGCQNNWTLDLQSSDLSVVSILELSPSPVASRTKPPCDVPSCLEVCTPTFVATSPGLAAQIFLRYQLPTAVWTGRPRIIGGEMAHRKLFQRRPIALGPPSPRTYFFTGHGRPSGARSKSSRRQWARGHCPMHLDMPPNTVRVDDLMSCRRLVPSNCFLAHGTRRLEACPWIRATIPEDVQVMKSGSPCARSGKGLPQQMEGSCARNPRLSPRHTTQ